MSIMYVMVSILLDVAFSRNGSNALPPSHRFGNFPAVSTAWVISNEDF